MDDKRFGPYTRTPLPGYEYRWWGWWGQPWKGETVQASWRDTALGLGLLILLTLVALTIVATVPILAFLVLTFLVVTKS
jgi:hypothetical protein